MNSLIFILTSSYFPFFLLPSFIPTSLSFFSPFPHPFLLPLSISSFLLWSPPSLPSPPPVSLFFLLSPFIPISLIFFFPYFLISFILFSCPQQYPSFLFWSPPSFPPPLVSFYPICYIYIFLYHQLPSPLLIPFQSLSLPSAPLQCLILLSHPASTILFTPFISVLHPFLYLYL